ncbi:hypothetical protein [Streptomyces sp. NPDC058701]|uniref:hypothetical protein n=1 Tax=Streptomyces sp. NPDC058701 TaxID=3346608 RepID=UPI00366972F7
MDASQDGLRASRSRLRTATLLCAAAALVAAAVPASAVQSQTRAAPIPDPVVVVDCFSEDQVRPETFLLACGDGNNRLVDLDWKTWGHRTATATGTDMANECRPNCAAGRFLSYPVSVTLANPEPWPDRPGVERFTTIRLLFPADAPSPIPQDVTYKLVY